MKITRFEDIEAWQVSRELCRSVQRVIGSGEFAKNYALKDQIDRASGSVMDNIAEGFNGGSTAEFIRFLCYAQRSCLEVQSQLYRALDRDFVSQSEFDELYEQADKARAKTGGLIKYLKSFKQRTDSTESTNE